LRKIKITFAECIDVPFGRLAGVKITEKIDIIIEIESYT
jgi:hypothetical protein